ncbi:hypothetical protein ABXT08_01650 [Chryseobacterium sp. NRRL B-14859]|uniref:hypothetical protein n=1 Tax=unclassified Chryseobacterium TaxID=2593645 RepID=UPI000F458B8A|nr:hypothetical protein [Chryseobacterium sp. G0240]ROI02328.1 hypothetical protein EGI16_15785 [Chryseobacterium sp. G0240]
MKNLVTLLVGLLLITFSCTSQTGNQAATTVPYTEAKNYFVKNTFKSNTVTVKKIISQQEFDEIFGAAATMGKDGQPTLIDFSKDYVIALIGTETNAHLNPEFNIKGLVKKGNSVILSYAKSGWSASTPASYNVMPMKILIVSKQYDGNVSSLSLK